MTSNSRSIWHVCPDVGASDTLMALSQNQCHAKPTNEPTQLTLCPDGTDLERGGRQGQHRHRSDWTPLVPTPNDICPATVSLGHAIREDMRSRCYANT